MDIAATNYGADEAGQICGFWSGADTPTREIGSVEAAQWLAAHGPQDTVETTADAGFLWLHFNLGHNASRRWLHGFWIVVAVVATITVIAGRIAFGRRRDDDG